jgi:hypothetical protein
MTTRLCTAFGAIALVLAIGPLSAFACGASHHTAHRSTATKVSLVSPSTNVKQTATR